MAWLLLLLAGAIEILWTFTLKASEGFTRPGYVALMLICIVATTWLLSVSVKTLPLGTAYAVWVGIGMVGTAIVGMVFFNESASLPRLGAIGLIAVGVIALNLLEA
jgi:quaternary ammonium compound-resistance protein SugE